MNSVLFSRTPKFIMFHLFCVDAALRPKEQRLEQIDKSNLCLSADPAIARRCLHLHHPTPPEEIVADLQEMRLTGLACVGLDGTNLAPDEIRSPRYRELIEKVHAAGLLFIHGFPFADAYDNRLTRQFPHIKQKTHDGRHPYVGWSEVNGHPNVDFGSDEFIAFCKECLDALAELGVTAIDYAEPDHYPWDDNGHGESLGKAWSKATGQPLPHPTTVAHRVFMEDRHQHGLRVISDYAHARGIADHLTESPLIHGSPLTCHNLGKLSRSRITQLSTTFHPHYFATTATLLEKEAQLQIQPNRTLGLGCIESKSMRGWDERHAVYFGVGQGLPPERMQDAMTAYVLLHQMDVCFWDYGNFRHQSMYMYNRFEEPAAKYKFFKKTVRDTIDTYLALPEDYRQAVAAPDALIAYGKHSDYARYVDKDPTKMSGWASLYVLAYQLQCSDLATMFAFDEYPEVLARDGRDVPLLIVDACQEISAGFADAIVQWLGPGKVLLTDDASLAAKLERPAAGKVICSAVPLARMARQDLAGLCDVAPRAKLTGEMPREVVRYRHGGQTFLAVKNYGAELSVLTVQTATKPQAVFPHDREVVTGERDGQWTTELNFQPFEVRILAL